MAGRYGTRAKQLWLWQNLTHMEAAIGLENSNAFPLLYKF